MAGALRSSTVQCIFLCATAAQELETFARFPRTFGDLSWSSVEMSAESCLDGVLARKGSGRTLEVLAGVIRANVAEQADTVARSTIASSIFPIASWTTS